MEAIFPRSTTATKVGRIRNVLRLPVHNARRHFPSINIIEADTRTHLIANVRPPS
jgi:hypothetical protein